MGPYEVFKTAQVELANTLSAELEGTEVYAFTIGPGIVKTPGFLQVGSQVAAMMGITVDQLLEMNKSVILSAEEAGTGFAAAVALASKYSGSEISSSQVLRDIGISSVIQKHKELNQVSSKSSADAMEKVLSTYQEQSLGWKRMNVFQRQWVMRDFKKRTGMSVDEMSSELVTISNLINCGEAKQQVVAETLQKLLSYYKHQKELLEGFEKDPKRLEENRKAIQNWIGELQNLLDLETKDKSRS